MPAQVKICGVTRAEDVDAAVAAGVAYLGLNFFPKSPRFLTFEQAAALAERIPAQVRRVALAVNESDAFFEALTRAVPLELLQLHGSETPDRVAEVKSATGLPVMKVIGVAEAGDMARIADYADVADQIMVDAKPPPGAALPGGNGLTFDWRLLEGMAWPLPWMLAGGLTPKNAAEAARRTGAPVLDVASGVEAAPGVKDAEKMRAFIAQGRAA
jgi:phosphoribosylanthranilate isomerase